MSTPSRPPKSFHDESHEDALLAWSTGDLADDDARLARRLETCAVCQRRMGELRAVTGLLDEVLGEERASIAALGDPARAPGAERVAPVLQALSSGATLESVRPARADDRPRLPSRRRSFGLAWRVGLAAASVMVAGWLVRRLLPPAETLAPDVTLGDPQGEFFPQGQVEAYGGFRWSSRSGAGVTYHLRVWDAESPLGAAPLVDVRLEEAAWNPGVEQLERLPDALRWQVTTYGPTGDSTSSPIVRAGRRGF